MKDKHQQLEYEFEDDYEAHLIDNSSDAGIFSVVESTSRIITEDLRFCFGSAIY